MSLFHKAGRQDERGEPIPGPSDFHSYEHLSNTKYAEGLLQLRSFVQSGEDETYQRMDLVAIHGLGGHPYDSWSSQGIIWFLDFLPRLIPAFDIRILSWGYNSRLAFGTSTFQTRDYATQLLSHLYLLRKSTSTSEIPIVFLYHSLGGIIFKKFLIIAHERNSIYSDLSKSTIGALFFGTPHAGSDVAQWTRIIRDIAKVFTIGRFRSDLLKNLERNSAELAEISTQFVERAHAIRIVSVYEGVTMNSIMPVVVDRNSASLNIPNEIILPIDANHKELCRFRDPQDPRYKPVLHALIDLIQNTTHVKEENLDVCLRSLYFPQYLEGRLKVVEAHSDTFSWIWHHPQYLEWENHSSSCLLWLQGKPTSGKSTLANYVRYHLNLRVSSIPAALAITVDFFYSVRGGDNQQGHRWMLQSILYQLLQQAPGLWEDYREHYEHRIITQDWTLDLLQSMFTSLGSKYDQKLPLIVHVVVDAIDEAEEENRQEIVRLLHNMSTGNMNHSVVIKLFFVSRPYVKFVYMLRDCLHIRLENETYQDIVKYVNGETRRIAQDVLPWDPLKIHVISQDLIHRSNGVFLWVKLVLFELEQRAMEGCDSLADIEEALKSIPQGLEDIYVKIFEKLNKQSEAAIKEHQLLFNWVAFSPEPLDIEQVREMYAASKCRESEISIAKLKSYRVSNADAMSRVLTTKCGNLLEVHGRTVEFIHETAREYFLRQKTPRKTHILEVSQNQVDLVSLYTRYLDYFNHTVRDFLKLSTSGTDWLSKDIAACAAMFDEPTLLPYCLKSYRHYADKFKHPTSSLHNIFKPFFDSVEATFCTLDAAILASILQLNMDSLKLFTQDPMQMRRSLSVRIGDDRVHYPVDTPLANQTCIRMPPLHVVACLKTEMRRNLWIFLKNNGADIDAKDENGKTALFLASKRGNGAIVGLLPSDRPTRSEGQFQFDSCSSGIGLSVPQKPLPLFSSLGIFRERIDNDQNGGLSTIHDISTRTRTQSPEEAMRCLSLRT